MATAKRSFGLVLIQIALAVIFVIAGLSLLGVNIASGEAGEVRSAVAGIFSNGTIVTITCIAIGVLLVASGVFFVIRIFWNPGKIDNLLKIITLIVWCVVAVFTDILGGLSILGLAKDVLIIGGILSIRD